MGVTEKGRDHTPVTQRGARNTGHRERPRPHICDPKGRREDRETGRDRETERQRDRDTKRQPHRETERQRQRE